MNRLLIVMPNWFGETLFVTPLLRILRSSRPHAFIAALGVPRAHDVLQGNPCLDEFVRFEPAGMGWPLVRRLRSLQLDTAFIPRRSVTRTLLTCAAGIPKRIGFANRKSGWLLSHRVSPPDAWVHKARAYLSLLHPVGIAVAGVLDPYEYYPMVEERERAEAFLRDHGIATARPMIVLHPGANWFHKRWPAERFAQLADRLGQSATVVITGSPDDRAVARAIARQVTTKPITLVGQTSVRQLAACLERADVVVSNDTGALHIASALGRPVVALYGPTSPVLTGPLGDPAKTVVLHHDACCPSIPCFNPDHPGYPGMHAISVDEVERAVLELLRIADCALRSAPLSPSNPKSEIRNPKSP